MYPAYQHRSINKIPSITSIIKLPTFREGKRKESLSAYDEHKLLDRYGFQDPPIENLACANDRKVTSEEKNESNKMAWIDREDTASHI